MMMGSFEAVFLADCRARNPKSSRSPGKSFIYRVSNIISSYIPTLHIPADAGFRPSRPPSRPAYGLDRCRT